MPGPVETCRRALAGFALPLVVVAVGQLAMAAGASLTGNDPSRNRTWVHWDAFRYLEIARDGYVEVPDDLKASNTGWFPGYPFLIRLVSRWVPFRPAFVGRAIALVFTVGLLAVIGSFLLPPLDRLRRSLALLVAGFFPGWVYWHAVFPVSMVVFFSLAAIALASRRRYLWAGISGALGAFCYPTGVLVALPLAVGIALEKGPTARERLAALLRGPAVVPLGLLAVLGVFHVTVGRWDAFFRYQEEIGGKELYNPFVVLADHLRPLLRPATTPESLISAQTALVTLLLVVAAWVVWRGRVDARALEAVLLVEGAAVWLFANAAGPDVSIYRQAAMLVCLVPILSRLRAPVLAAVIAVLLPLGAGMVALFFLDVLV